MRLSNFSDGDLAPYRCLLRKGTDCKVEEKLKLNTCWHSPKNRSLNQKKPVNSFFHIFIDYGCKSVKAGKDEQFNLKRRMCIFQKLLGGVLWNGYSNKVSKLCIGDISEGDCWSSSKCRIYHIKVYSTVDKGHGLNKNMRGKKKPSTFDFRL